MIIDVFNEYAEAKRALSTYIDSARKHPGLRDIEYRIYTYCGKYAIYRGRKYSDFPGDRKYILAAKVC